MNYGTRLEELRENQNLSLQDISKMLAFDKDTYGKFEREYTTIPLIHLNTLCNYFKVSIDYILGFTSKKQYQKIKEDIDLKIAGMRLKELRKENKLTLIKLGNILGCSYGTIASYESGKQLIATHFLYQICKNYNISADYLLGKIDEPKYLKW